MPIRTCLQCGKEFEGATKRSNYCSGPCVNAKEIAYGRRHAKTFSPQRRVASIRVHSAIRRGDLVRQPCEVCGEARMDRIVAHHDDYAAPLDVRWLCRSHHKQHHVKFGPGRNA